MEHGLCCHLLHFFVSFASFSPYALRKHTPLSYLYNYLY